MPPFTLFLKAVAEGARAFTPSGSPMNQISSAAKQAVAIFNGFTADTQARWGQAIIELFSEFGYANAASEKERFLLTIGNTFMLAREGAQYIQAVNQPMQTYLPATVTPPWLQAYPNQRSQFIAELQRQVEEQRQALMLQRRQQQLEERDREVTELKRRLGIL